jgi:hypothetical protein
MVKNYLKPMLLKFQIKNTFPVKGALALARHKRVVL